MSELTKGQVQETATLVVESMQATINRFAETIADMDAEIEALKLKLKAAQAIAADLREENADLRARLARLESGKKQTIYPWKEDGTI